MWFSVAVCTLIDNDTRHHSGQNVVHGREHGGLSFFIVVFETVLGRNIQGRFQKNSSATFISEESP